MAIFNLQKSVPVHHHRLSQFNPLRGALDKVWEDFYSDFPAASFSKEEWENFSLHPAVDIVEDKESFKVEAEMPGMGFENIEVSVSEGMLTISGKKTTSKKDKDKNYIAREINYGSYYRCIALPPYLDTDKAEASFRKGMLWVTIPKRAEGGAHNIQIKQA